MVAELKEKFHDEKTSTAEKIQILTVMPPNWSVEKIVRVMGATKYLVGKAKQLYHSEGILATPAPKIGKNELEFKLFPLTFKLIARCGNKIEFDQADVDKITPAQNRTECMRSLLQLKYLN